MRALVVIPTYNEADSIRAAVAGALADPRVHVLVVDDASPDGTGALVRAMGEGDDRIALLERPAKMGLGPAYLAAFDRALTGGYDAVVEMDADLSHDPADVTRLLDALEGADLAIGSRYVPGGATRNWSLLRRGLSRAGNIYAQALLRLPLRDSTSGFRAFRAPVLRALPLGEVRSEGYAFQIELAWRAWAAGFAVTEVPISFTERRSGSSKFSRAIVLEALASVLRWALRRARPAGPHPESVA